MTQAIDEQISEEDKEDLAPEDLKHLFCLKCNGLSLTWVALFGIPAEIPLITSCGLEMPIPKVATGIECPMCFYDGNVGQICPKCRAAK